MHSKFFFKWKELHELQDFVILQVVMFYPYEEQRNLIQDVSQIGVLMRSSRTWSRMYLISENIDNSPYALPVGRPGLEELHDFMILQVVMFYPDEEQQNLDPGCI